ncbi:MAG: IS66 family insertion sequence element accessory protein TnpB, partial [Gammaproteobacteria bacterium]|nr:IS66 family insertion sequence element accessory protein TnpB [Gammaproteobacteria bacterium]
LVEAELAQDPFLERLFVFINRMGTSIKILYWERNGFCLWQKRLEQERRFSRELSPKV